MQMVPLHLESNKKPAGGKSSRAIKSRIFVLIDRFQPIPIGLGIHSINTQKKTHSYFLAEMSPPSAIF